MSPAAERGAAAADQQTPIAPSAPPSFTDALRNWLAIMSLLMVEQMNRRTRSGRFGLVIMIAEPFALVLTFYWIHGMIKGVVQPYGESLFLFLVSGLLPFYLFMRTSIRGRVGRVDSGRRLPRITSLDIFMAGAAAQTAIWIPVIGATFVGMWLYGIEQARPVSISDCVSALFFLALLGTGLGLINLVIGRFLPSWPIIIGLATRGMIFLSGVIHIPDFFYPSVRAWLAWNPILHGVDWFRLGVYGRYPILLLDQFYLVKCAVILVFIGLVADRATLRHGARDH
jgi:capsular polysaccharide transport system permease protein